MWKWLLIAAALFVLYKLFTGERGRKEKDEAKAKDKKIAAGEMVKDPICGTYVDVESSIKVRDGKKVHCFCSYECRQKFLDELEGQGRELPRIDGKGDD
jgi:YHS domain-containing protein